MSDSAVVVPGTDPQRRVRNANLLPEWEPGQTGNPTGVNQYTYRRNAEASLEKWCKEHGDAVIERLVLDAQDGKGYAMALVLDRILPVVKHVELSVPGVDVSGLVDAVAARAATIRTIEPDREPDASTDGSGV